jgi:hypothetical protein
VSKWIRQNFGLGLEDRAIAVFITGEAEGGFQGQFLLGILQQVLLLGLTHREPQQSSPGSQNSSSGRFFAMMSLFHAQIIPEGVGQWLSASPIPCENLGEQELSKNRLLRSLFGP